MENGIGRAGYRLLALVFLAFGLLGLGLQWVEGTVTHTVGIGVAAAALMVLAALTYLLTPAPRPLEVVEEPVRELDYEMPAPEPVKPAPVPMVELTVQPKAEAKHDMGTLRDRYTRDTPMVREILTNGGQTQHKPVPEITARRVPKGARPEQAPAGTSMGRCGSCNTVIYAPTARPLRLRCPACSKVTLLK